MGLHLCQFPLVSKYFCSVVHGLLNMTYWRAVLCFPLLTPRLINHRIGRVGVQRRSDVCNLKFPGDSDTAPPSRTPLPRPSLLQAKTFFFSRMNCIANILSKGFLECYQFPRAPEVQSETSGLNGAIMYSCAYVCKAAGLGSPCKVSSGLPPSESRPRSSSCWEFFSGQWQRCRRRVPLCKLSSLIQMHRVCQLPFHQKKSRGPAQSKGAEKCMHSLRGDGGRGRGCIRVI